ncbi:MAG: hypothetical protein P4L41_14500 [Flavipsychrobacter sp.]|nr:hypothetical protein [Flavipsychrobacter sp.]
MQDIRRISIVPVLLFALVFTMCMSSCATIFGGKILTCQKVKPQGGVRPIRVVVFIADTFFPPALITDFLTGAIYKPCNKPNGNIYSGNRDKD